MAKAEKKVPRSICWTCNNYAKEGRMAQVEWLRTKCKYFVYGKEVGESGTPHLQGYAEFQTQVRLQAFAKGAHDINFEERKCRDPKRAADYCKKGDQSHAEWEANGTAGPNYGKNADVFEEGEISSQGRRNDIEACTTLIMEGHRMRQVAVDNPVAFVKFNRGLIAFKQIMVKPRCSRPEVIVRYGPTGSGKTLLAKYETNDAYVWTAKQMSSGQTAWFDGYDNESEVVFEEFRGQIAFDSMLNILDRYDCKVQVKGAMCEFVATKIVLTSPIPPWEWYPRNAANLRDNIAQLQRRISRVYEHDHNPRLGEMESEGASLEDVANEVVCVEVAWPGGGGVELARSGDEVVHPPPPSHEVARYAGSEVGWIRSERGNNSSLTSDPTPRIPEGSWVKKYSGPEPKHARMLGDNDEMMMDVEQQLLETYQGVPATERLQDAHWMQHVEAHIGTCIFGSGHRSVHIDEYHGWIMRPSRAK